MPRVLVLGGTTEASRLAQALADTQVDAVFSYAGRTESPLPQPLPVRVGGFGGVDGLRAWLREQRISHVVDATHPFAAQMSRNAVGACAATGIPLLALERPAWQAQAGDHWQPVPDMDSAVRALPEAPARVFLAIGRQHLAPFLAQPQHWFLLRLVDASVELPLERGHIVLARGPFTEAGDTALLRQHRITHVVAKNSGGSGAEAKLSAARALGLPVILIDRPIIPARSTVGGVDEVLQWLADPHGNTGRATERGV
ncbi:cobalt-precorrin-6A reductase [Rhodoferax saidenbachensis]|uniref:Precorrin-6A reductase n=1 Tax=Rhodoferax saidenbachensis TaxID=1484693 RepID=A0A1P8KFR2_9BURK|nr:cobalt-precorrin-6A reductase [Rhodoferax saidenbachensis]APW44815.1 precorrin-6A reductase [Rhodoferax saidenbachensis]